MLPHKEFDVQILNAEESGDSAGFVQIFVKHGLFS